MEDERIIALFWRRDEGAISQASRKYGAYCRSIAMHILGDSESCEECVNDTWLRAWNAIPPARPAVLRAFLGRITRNLSLSMLRGRTRAKRGGGQALLALDELEDCVPDLQTPEKVLEDREIAQSINRWLAACLRNSARRSYAGIGISTIWPRWRCAWAVAGKTNHA